VASGRWPAMDARPSCGRSQVVKGPDTKVPTLSVANWRGKPATSGGDISGAFSVACGETSGFGGLTRMAADRVLAGFSCCAPPKRLRACLRQGGSDLVATLTPGSHPGLRSFARCAGWSSAGTTVHSPGGKSREVWRKNVRSPAGTARAHIAHPTKSALRLRSGQARAGQPAYWPPNTSRKITARSSCVS
jgi:hypothetical protein